MKTCTRWRLYLVSSAVFCFVLPLQSVVAQDDIGSRVKELGQPYIDSKTVVGLSIGVIKSGVATAVNLGGIDLNGPVPNDNTVYEIGSVSKVFTGILLGDAVATKSVMLGQTAQSLLPDHVRIPRWKEHEISLLDLVTHRSGLPRLADNMPSLMSDNPYSDYTSTLAHEFLNDYQLPRKPGSQVEYSNFGASLLGHLLSSRAKKSYDQLLTERICQPLGMGDTRVTLTDSMAERLATPYAESGQQGHRWDWADMPGAGGVRSTVADMLLFAQANLDPPASEIGDALNLAWKKHRWGQPAMGLGWNLFHDGSTRWHNGRTGGYSSSVFINRKLKTAVVVLSNTSSSELDPLGEQIMRMLAGQPVKPRVFAPEFKVSSDTMQRYVGKYSLTPNFVLTVSVDDGKLMVGATGQSTHRVYPRSDTLWHHKVVDASITFKTDENGSCAALVLHQNGIDQIAEKMQELPAVEDPPATKDIVTPPMSGLTPAAGRRVRQVAPEYEGTDVYHALYLPVDWKPGGSYPVIVEYTGNKFPPTGSTGEVKDANLGYGLTGGRGFIWVSMPYIDNGRKKNALRWWGDKQATVDYCKSNLPRICESFGGDKGNVLICGFSRGAIAASYIGLADDEIASLWKGMITHDHFDGEKEWSYPDSDRTAALSRLARLKGRPVLVCGGSNDFLRGHKELAAFTFLKPKVSEIFDIPEGPVVHVHTDLWMHRESTYQKAARRWLEQHTTATSDGD